MVVRALHFSVRLHAGQSAARVSGTCPTETPESETRARKDTVPSSAVRMRQSVATLRREDADDMAKSFTLSDLGL
jgi:hypothetical protein